MGASSQHVVKFQEQDIEAQLLPSILAHSA